MRTEEDKYELISRISNRDRKQYEQFLLALGEFFPNRSPSIKDDDRMIWFKAGQSSVISFLEKVYKDSMEQALER